MRERVRRRLLAGARTTAAVAGLSAIFVVSLGGALLLHASLPPSRRVFTRVALDALNREIQGQITAESVERLALTRVELRGVTITDGRGRTVLKGNHLEARVETVSVLRSLLWEKGDIVLRIPWVRAEQLDVVLEQDPDGVLTVARAFEPPVRPPKPAAPPKVAPRHLVVDLPHIEIGSAYAQGALASIGQLDAEARTVRGAVRVGPEGVSIDTERSAVAVRKPVPLPMTGAAEFHLRTPGAIWGYFAGMAGDIELTSAGRLEGQSVDVTVDLPAVKGATLSVWLPGTDIRQTVAARLEVHGTLSELATTLTARMGETHLDARGSLSTAVGVGGWDVELRNVDLRSIVPEAPFTQLGADARVQLARGPDSGMQVELKGAVHPGLLATYALPPADFEAVADARGVTGRALVHEPGMPLTADFTVSREGVVTVKASSKIASIEAAPRLGRVLRGRAEARLDARVEKGALDLVLAADVHGVSRGPVKLAAGRLQAHAWGKPEELLVDASVTGRGVQVGTLQWADGTVQLRGPVRSPRLTVSLTDDVGPSVKSSAELSLAKRFVARELHVEVGRGGQGFSVSAESVDVRDGTIDLGGIAVDGLGAPLDGVVKFGPSSFDVRLVSSGIDLAKLSRVLALPGMQLAGTASVDIDLRNSGAESAGCARIEVRGGSYGGLGGIEASARAHFAGTKVLFDSNVAVGAEASAAKVKLEAGACLPAAPVGTRGLVEAHAAGELVLDGSPMRARSWSQATGTARLTRMAVDMTRLAGFAQLAQRLAPGVAIPKVQGTITLQAKAERLSPSGLAGWSATASTRNFELAVKDTSITNADVVVSLAMEPSGLLRTSVCARKPSDTAAATCDEGDRYVVAQGKTQLDYGQLLSTPSAWRKLLEEAQTQATVLVPERSISDLVSPVLRDVELPLDARRAAVVIDLTGSWRKPHVSLSGYLDRPEIGGEALPALVCLSGGWDGVQGTSTALLRRRTRSDRRPLHGLCAPGQGGADESRRGQGLQSVGLVQSSFQARWEDVLAASRLSDVPFEADATFAIDNLPLADLADGPVAGTVSGRGGIKGLGKKPEFAADLQLQGLRLGPAFSYDRGSVVLRSDVAGLRGTVELIDPSRSTGQEAPGRLDAELTSPLPVRFADGWVPELAEGQELKVKLRPSRFRIGSLLPFTEPALSHLEGDVSGYVDATWVAGAKGSRIDDAFLVLTDGGFQIPTVGQEFIGVSATVKTSAANQLVVEAFRANAVSGSVAGTASISLEDLRVVKVAGALSVNEQNKLRLTIEGVPVGDVYGQVHADVTLGPERNDVRVRASGLNLELSEADQRKVQGLGLHPEVLVVPSPDLVTDGRSWSRQVKTKESSSAMTPWRVTLSLLEPMRIQRSGMRFSVNTMPGGQNLPTIDFPGASGAGPSMKGVVRLEDGRVDVVGKFFAIDPDRALVTFKDEPSNPDLAVTARWDATDGTRVYADVTGKLKDPHVQLRSEPPRPPSELLAMILFGGAADASATRTDPSARTGGGSGAAAAGVGSGVAAAGINRLLANVVPMGISTRIDTSQRQNVRPTVVIEVASNVTAEATVNTGTVPLGQNPDRYMLTLDWRFLRAWSLRTTVGDAGSSILDVLWTHRY